MMAGNMLAFGGAGGVARAAHLRERAEALLVRPAARVLALRDGHVPLDAAGGLCLIEIDHPLLSEAGPERLFLGLSDGVPVFAAELTGPEPAPGGAGGSDAGVDGEAAQPSGALPDTFADLRSVMAALSPQEGELAATARGLLEWHRSHPFCARCGTRGILAMAGWERHCPACKARHFPRTDPVVIMLVVHGNSVLIGRSPGWPEGMYSLLAGFVEPGETIEAAVRREVEEEAGVWVGRVEYLASQPWPFPASLMIGCRAEAEGCEIRIDPAEIEDARWLTREEMLEAFSGRMEGVRPPRPGSIARYLLWNWLADRPLGWVAGA